MDFYSGSRPTENGVSKSEKWFFPPKCENIIIFSYQVKF